MFIYVEDGVKKAHAGKYIVYNAEWFKEHFEQERKLYGKKGKWIKAIDPDVNAWTVRHICSECGRACVQMSMNFYANCGAPMEVDT